MLFQAALEYMKQEHLSEFYLLAIDYGFYEQDTFQIKGQQATMHFFIYDYQC